MAGGGHHVCSLNPQHIRQTNFKPFKSIYSEIHIVGCIYIYILCIYISHDIMFHTIPVKPNSSLDPRNSPKKKTLVFLQVFCTWKELPAFHRWSRMPKPVSVNVLKSGEFAVVTMVVSRLPSGKHTKNYGKSPFLMGKLTINGDFQ